MDWLIINFMRDQLQAATRADDVMGLLTLHLQSHKLHRSFKAEGAEIVSCCHVDYVKFKLSEG